MFVKKLYVLTFLLIFSACGWMAVVVLVGS
jgi:hypothetical protein